ncbi:MAG: hypothetical protein KC464_24465, partial [Myxococcales bacterium]|nr:hypothetical protein [Myxococcales bacterium]
APVSSLRAADVAVAADLGTSRAAMGKAVDHLPDDTRFAMGVMVGEVRADRDLSGLIDVALDSPTGRALVFQTALESCSLDLRGLTTWAIMAGPGDDGVLDVIVSGQWSRDDGEACLVAALEGTGVRRDGAVSSIAGPHPRAIAWLDDHTFYLSSRKEADAAWMAARVADVTTPAGALTPLLPEVDLTATAWFAGEDLGKKLGLESDGMTGLWGSASVGGSSLSMLARVHYLDDKTARAAQADLQAQIDGLDLNGLATLSVTIDRPAVLRVDASVPRFIIGIAVSQLQAGGLPQ